MNWRVVIEDDFPAQGIALRIGDVIGDRVNVVMPTEIVLQAHDRNVTWPDGPSLRLPDDLGRALLDALSAHYGGTSDTRTLRRDYEHERGRVDRLIGHLVGSPAPAQRGA
jgi:hypothetical protein